MENGQVKKRSLNWAVVGTGVIANEMAAALQKMGKRLYGVANRTHAKAVAFAETYGVERVYDRLEQVFEDDRVDVIYLTTPHNTHYALIKRALEQGKHVLAEKSITLNQRELEELVALAEQKGLVLAEAMTIWHMPLYKKLWALMDSSRLGQVQMISVNFGSFKPYDMSNRFFNLDLAGGALLDIGVYALSLTRSFLSAQPNKVLSQMKPSPTGSDEMATILLENDAGQMAAITLSMHSKQPKRAMISGETGYLELMEYPRGDRAFFVDAVTGDREEIAAGETGLALVYELEDMESAILDGNTAPMRLSHTRDVMALMTRLRQDWGLRYPGEVW